MIAKIPARDETELERLFAQARRYDLLSREQEQEIDERKWQAVTAMLALLIKDPFSRHYLMRLASACRSPLPEIDQFQQRLHRTLLRRELGEYLPGGKQAKKTDRLTQQFSQPYCEASLLACFTEMSLPTSLIVGIAETVMHSGQSDITAALEAWERYWPRQYADVSATTAATVQALEEQIKLYLCARDLLIKHNLRLVYTIVGRNRDKGVPFLDLVQEGNLGLLRAAEKFQFTRGYRFSTYAFNWITQRVKRSLVNAAGTIRYPIHVQTQLGQVHGERARMHATLGRAPGDTELAESLELSVEKTRELLQLRNLGVSLDAPRFEDDEGTTLLDSLPGGPFARPAANAEQASLHDKLVNELRHLSKAEKNVVMLRWGLDTAMPLSRAEIADKLSVSKEWVRQLEASALKKLRESESVQDVYRDHTSSPDPTPRTDP
mgnify:CR=1 FL=1